MRFTCEKNMLVTGLNITSRTVAQKSNLSVIEGILCCAGSGLMLTGYNMETAITFPLMRKLTIPVNVFCLPSFLVISCAVCLKVP